MDDMDKTIPPKRTPGPDGDDVTMPGRRDRKPDGRFSVGDLIMSRYKVLAELGQGGMGVVYKCFDETAGIEVALKALPPELSHNTLEMEDIKDNFQLVSKLVHQNIAISKNLEKDNSNGNYYLIMECCDGEDLRRWIKRKRKEGDLKPEDILPIIKQVAEALDYAHEMKIIHRDIKPGNIMIDPTGKIKVLDFGLAAQIHTSMTRVSMAYHGTSGTGPYMAPEQWRGRAQRASADQYALAVMTYEMLAGHLPFESADPAVLQQAVLTQTAEDIPDVPQSVQKAIARAMSKEPAERFVSCADFVAALEGKKVKGAKSVFGDTDKVWNYLAIVAFVALAVMAGVYVFQGSPKQSGGNTSSSGNNSEASNSETHVSSNRSSGASNSETHVSSNRSSEASNSETHVSSKRSSKAELNVTVALPNGVKLEMVKVEPGTFTMSRNDGENYGAEVAHEKTLTYAYYIGKYEVTNEQWCAVMNVSKAPSLKNKGAKYPVENISWREAMAFCEKMNQYAPSGWRFTLPTETQWEFAARGGNRSNGYKYSGSDNLNDVGWYDDNSGDTTHEVGSKSPNELGLYDMSGNVWEWCLDNWQDKSNNTRAEFSRPYRDSDGSYRVRRGGGWASYARNCRSAHQNYDSPGFRYNGLGFRLALVPVQ